MSFTYKVTISITVCYKNSSKISENLKSIAAITLKALFLNKLPFTSLDSSFILIKNFSASYFHNSISS